MEGFPQPSHTAEVNDVGRYPIEERFTIIVVVSQVPETLVQEEEQWTPISAHDEQTISKIVARVQRDLDEDRKEEAAEGNASVSDIACRRCVGVAREIAPFVVPGPETELVAFAEESGAVSLILQGFDTGRRVTFSISTQGRVVPIRIDGGKVHRENEMLENDPQHLQELAEWVRRRS